MTEPLVEVRITNENLIPLLELLQHVALAEVQSFLADKPDDRLGRAAEYLTMQEQVLSSVADPHGAVVQAVLRACRPCPCGRQGSVQACVVYRAVEGGTPLPRRKKRRERK